MEQFQEVDEEEAEEGSLVDVSMLIKSMEGLKNDLRGGGPSRPTDDISCLTEFSVPLSDIYEPGANDVIFGPADDCIENDHEGNTRFRRLINDYTKLYQSTPAEQDKGVVVAEVVRIWRSLEPPGRFLVSSDPGISSTPYHDIGDEDARWRATKLLKDDTNTKHSDDVTASTAGSSTMTRPRESNATEQARRPSHGECFGGSFRGLLMHLFSNKNKDAIMNQYLP